MQDIASNTYQTYRKSNQSRTKNDIIAEGKLKHPNQSISYDFIPENGIFKLKDKIIIKHEDCGIIWVTNSDKFLNGVGRYCPWCEQSKINHIYLITIQQICNKIYGENKYILNKKNDSNKKYSVQENISVWCGNKDHEPFDEKISVLISFSKRPSNLTKGCEKCLNKDIEKINWRGNLKALVEEGNKRHNNQYDYSLVNYKNLANNRSLIKIRCKSCDGTFNISINEHINSYIGCGNCYGNKKYNLELFLEKARERHSEGKFLYHHIQEEDIEDNKSIIKVECGDCGYIDLVGLYYFLNKKTECSSCNGTERWNVERLKIACEEKAKERRYDYSLVNFTGDIKGHMMIDIICLQCKNKGLPKELYTFKQTVTEHFTCGRNCRNCEIGIPYKLRIQYECEERAKEGEYDYSLVDYSKVENGETQIDIICLKCQKEGFYPVFKQRVAVHFGRNAGCLKCLRQYQYDYDYVQELIEHLPELFRSQFIYDRITPEVVENADSIVEIGCVKCNKYFDMSLTDHLTRNFGCRYCRKSAIAKMVELYLDKNNIQYKDEVACPDYKGNKRMHFDFKVYYKGKWIIIEVDGQQHIVRNTYHHPNEGDFERSRERDIYKQLYALKQGWYVVRIDYSVQNDLQKYLEEGLNSNEKVYYSTPKLYEWIPK